MTVTDYQYLSVINTHINAPNFRLLHNLSITVKTIQQDLMLNNLSLNETIDVAQHRPLWRLMSTFGTMNS